MNFKTILKVISAIVAIAGVAVAVYLAIQKLTAPKRQSISTTATSSSAITIWRS